MNVLIGLAGIGLVIFFHELGHLLAAKSVGVTVEAFSIGWGRKIWSVTRGGTDYRLSWIPVGGYCKMKGEHALIRAWNDKLDRIDVEPGDFYAARPWQRIWVLAAGPLINLFFAAVVMTVIAFAGYTIQTYENRIVLVSDYTGIDTPATAAGLRTGDYITSIDEKPITSYYEMQSIVGTRANKELAFEFERDGVLFRAPIIPALDSATGAGRIGVYPWVDPVIAAVEEGMAADLAGLKADDRILAVDGTRTPHTIAVHHALKNAGNSVDVQVLRDDRTVSLRVIPGFSVDGEVQIGIAYRTLSVESPRYSLGGAVIAGIREAYSTLVLTISGIRLLFSGVDVTQAVMGPVRITVLAGEITTEGFRSGFGTGLLAFFNFLSLISIALCFMNLLPIPALDGGQILLSLAEGIRRKALHPRFVYRYQVVGNVLILGLMVFALFNDILFFARG